MKETTKEMAKERILFVFDPITCNEQINDSIAFAWQTMSAWQQIPSKRQNQ